MSYRVSTKDGWAICETADEVVAILDAQKAERLAAIRQPSEEED
jgi:hypothetical protein